MTRGWTEAIFFPDTVYTITVGTGVADYLLHSGMQVMPNPFDGRTQVNIHSAKTESVTMALIDINGKRCAEYNGLLSDGNNYFEIELVTPQTYILSVDTTFSGNRQGICPLGWHVPTDAEWNDMEYVVNGSDVSSSEGWRGTHAGKLAGGHDWTNSNTSGAPGDYTYSDRNSSGFSAVPVGFCSAMFGNGSTIFQSSSQYEYYPKYTWARELTYYNAGVNRLFNYAKSSGGSVRCLRD